MARQDNERVALESSYPIIARKPDWLENTLTRIEKLVPRFLRPKTGSIFSLKNRILFATLSIVVGGVFFIGVILQLTVFPKLKGDPSVILNLKIIHFVVSVVVIALSFLFIELVSKKITLPLMDLTKTADRISREAGESIAPSSVAERTDSAESLESQDNQPQAGDEISQLMSSFNRMIAHLKASEVHLRESEEKYRFLFDNSPFPKFVIDAQTMQIVDVNARAEEDYQYTRQELLGMNFVDLMPVQYRKFAKALLREIGPTEETLFPVLHHRRRDGSTFMVNFQARLSRFRDRPAIIAGVWDVTEKLEKHAMLIQAGKMATLGEMATGIAHELNQPLNVLRLGCDYLEKKLNLEQPLAPEEWSAVLKLLTGSVERSSRIINHLRQFGRKSDETMITVNVNEPIRNVFTILGTQLKTGGIECKMDLDENLPPVKGDANRLEQVFINLVLNARDAMLTAAKKTGPHEPPQSNVITIRSFFEADNVVVTVTDTGPGIPEELKSRVFEPFFTTKERGEGTGLGLSISYRIIRDHRGTVELYNAETGGAVFRVTIPALGTEKDHGETTGS